MFLRLVFPAALTAVLLCGARPADENAMEQRAERKADEWITLDQAARGSGGVAREPLLRNIEDFLLGHPDEEWAYAASAIGYNRLDRNSDAMMVIRKYRAKFPESVALDKSLEFFVFNFGDLADLRGLPERFQSNPYYWKTLLRKAKKAGEPDSTLAAAARGALEAMNEDNDPDGHNRAGLGEDLLSMSLDPVLAERAARESLKAGELTRPMDHILPTLPPETMKMALRMFNYSIYRSTLGWALAAQGRYKEARDELRRAAQLVAAKHVRTHARAFYRLGQIHERLNEPEAAVEAYINEAATGGDTKAARQALARLLPKGDFWERINEAATAWALADPESREVEQVDERLGRFELKRYDGKPFAMDALKGKIVIVDFWASWCVSCRPSLESSDRLQRQFAEDVVILAPAGDFLDTQVNAAEFLASHGYRRFIHLIDDPAARDLQPPWIPARFVIDRKGRVRFRELGASEHGIATFESQVRALLQGEQ